MPTPLTSDEEFDAHFRRGLEHDANLSEVPDAEAWQRMELLLDTEPTPPPPHRARRRLSAAVLVLLLLTAGISWHYQSSLRRWATGPAAPTAGSPSPTPEPARRLTAASPQLPAGSPAIRAAVVTAKSTPSTTAPTAKSSKPGVAPATSTSSSTTLPAGPGASTNIVSTTSASPSVSVAVASAAGRPAAVPRTMPDTASSAVKVSEHNSPSRSHRLALLPLGAGTKARRQLTTERTAPLASRSNKQLLHKEHSATSHVSTGTVRGEVAERGLPASAHAVAASPTATGVTAPLAGPATRTPRGLSSPRATSAASRSTTRAPRPAPTEARRLTHATAPGLASALASPAARRHAHRRGAAHTTASAPPATAAYRAGLATAARASAQRRSDRLAHLPALPQAGVAQLPQTVDLLAGTGLPGWEPDSLPATLPLARVTPFDSLPQPKPLPTNLYRLHVGLLAAPELSAVRQRGTGVGGSGGIEIEYRLASRWRLSAGYLQAIKHYAAAGSDYRLAAAWPSTWLLNDVTASCRIIDVPLNLRYDVWQSSQRRAFVSGGLSSLFMRREDYTYNYEVGGKPRSSEWQFLNYSNHPFQVLNLSVGYEQRLNQRWALQAEPYLKLPLGGVGYGAVRLQSAGVFFSLKYGLLRGSAAR